MAVPAERSLLSGRRALLRAGALAFLAAPAWAQGRGGPRGPHPGAPFPQRPLDLPPDCPEHPALATLVATYAQLARLDTDGDGRFSEAELPQLRQAIEGSELRHQSPAPIDALMGRLQRVYAWLHTFDADRDGRIEGPERAALAAHLQSSTPHASQQRCLR